MRRKTSKHDPKKSLSYWNSREVESMYDKNLLRLETELIKARIPRNSKILDAGCGEGEGTLEYSKIPGVTIHAVDFSDTRLKMAARRLSGRKNIILKKVDFLGEYSLDKDYDVIISQRFIINLLAWRLQKKVLLDLKSMLKKGGKLIILEGSIDGASSMNKFRKALGLKPIPIKWHNLFLKDNLLVNFMKANRMKLTDQDGVGEYYMLTRGVRAFYEKEPNWDARFNEIARSLKIKEILNLGTACSRLKLWVFKKS